MNTGIGDVINLGWKLAMVIQHRAPVSLLDSYEAERIPFARKLVQTTDAAFSAIVSPDIKGTLTRRVLMPLAFLLGSKIDAARHAMFHTVAQIEIAYGDSVVSAGRAGEVKGGDRLPWAGKDGDDNFVPLVLLDWQVHVYGNASAELTASCRQAAQTRPAIQRSLTAILTGMKSFAERAQCNSCHHQGLEMIVLGTAQQRGFLVDKEVVGSYLKQVGEDGQRNGPVVHEALTHSDTAKTIPAVDIGDISIGAGYIFGGLIANGVPGNPGLQEMAQFLAAQQQPDGHWSYGITREPMQDSLVMTTALVTQVMRVYGEADKPGPTADALHRAKKWFLTCPATTAEDKTARLLGLVWAGATAEERKKPVQELLAAQRPDGGWAIASSSGSDAYATGIALYALHVGGSLSANAPAYRRGARFLLRTQDEDGTWYLNKRANPANTYFDAGFPNGVSQYASFAATCWATLALMQTDVPTQQAQR